MGPEKKAFDIMDAVAGCESGNGTPGSGQQFYPNGKIVRDYALGNHVGLFQIAESWSPTAKKMGMDIYTAAGNRAFAEYLHEKDGLHDWLASQSCWSKYQ